jgi:hypothetical protein
MNKNNLTTLTASANQPVIADTLTTKEESNDHALYYEAHIIRRDTLNEIISLMEENNAMSDTLRKKGISFHKFDFTVLDDEELLEMLHDEKARLKVIIQENRSAADEDYSYEEYLCEDHNDDSVREDREQSRSRYLGRSA